MIDLMFARRAQTLANREAPDVLGGNTSTTYTKNHLGTVTSAKPGSIRTTCGTIEAK